MFFRPKDGDRVVHSRARDRARWAIRDHGDAAEAVIGRKLARPNQSAGARELHKLTLRELRVLRLRGDSRSLASTPGRVTRLLIVLGLAGRRRSH